MKNDPFVSELEREMSAARREADSYHFALVAVMSCCIGICFSFFIYGG